ncbi:MAG: UDP-N-acetylmuramoyl-tripeptide--D-alanyl-D-alanine ligase [Agarilytica sp.]
MKLSMLAEKNIGRLVGSDCEFEHINTDTRSIEKGDVFVALKGERFDGHDMLRQATERGACALVVEHEVPLNVPQLVVDNTTVALGSISAQYREQFSGKVLAITGSCGKTTVKGMLDAICNEAGACMSTRGNFNNHIGVPLTLARLNADFNFAVVEAGTSNPGEIAYLADLIQPDVAVVTNVMPAHIGGFGSLSAVAKEKAAIYGDEKSDAIAVVNLDDANFSVLSANLTDRRVIGFTLNDQGGFTETGISEYVSLVRASADELGCYAFVAKYRKNETDEKTISVSLPVIGMHNIANALAAISAAVAVGISFDHIKQGLEKFTGENGRMQVKRSFSGATVIDDSYNANPGSVKAAIDAMAGWKESILVCGDMAELGEDSQRLHKEVGEYAKSKKIKTVMTVGVESAALSSAFGEGVHFSNKAALEEALQPLINERSLVLIKGSRSAAMETIVHTLTELGGK